MESLERSENGASSPANSDNSNVVLPNGSSIAALRLIVTGLLSSPEKLVRVAVFSPLVVCAVKVAYLLGTGDIPQALTYAVIGSLITLGFREVAKRCEGP